MTPGSPTTRRWWWTTSSKTLPGVGDVDAVVLIVLFSPVLLLDAPRAQKGQDSRE